MMLSTSQSFASASSSTAGFPNLSGFLSGTPVETDPNSPELFKQNINLIREHVSRLQQLSRNALGGIQNAYHAGSSPLQTEADLTALKQTLQTIVELLAQTGVGALPLLPPQISDTQRPLPTEEQLLAQTNQSIQLYFEQLKRSQESAGVVANLLGAPDHSSRAAR